MSTPNAPETQAAPAGGDTRHRIVENLLGVLGALFLLLLFLARLLATEQVHLWQPEECCEREQRDRRRAEGGAGEFEGEIRELEGRAR